MRPEYWTIYSYEKAKEISKALPEGWEQKVMIRIYADGDTYYKGHEGGFPATDVVEVAKNIDAMPGLKFAGITTFPTQLFNAESCTVRHTHNYTTLLEAKKALEAARYENIEVNAPGTTSSHLFEEMGESGCDAGRTGPWVYRHNADTCTQGYDGKAGCCIRERSMPLL